jgi:glycosyltransferase involved in cell wall biosynthesis
MVSVILPNYNHAPFLSRRLESIFNQSFQDFEVILLDDASTDDSLSILKEYENHPKVSYTLWNRENSGRAFDQWKKGIEKARGEWIWIAESDDYCHPDFLRQLLDGVDEHTVLSYCSSMIIDEQGNELGRYASMDSLDACRWFEAFTNNGKDEVTRYLSFMNTIPNASAVIFKKASYREEFLDNTYKYCGDWSFWKMILRDGDISYIPENLNFFRQHAQTTRAFNDLGADQSMFCEFFELMKERLNWFNSFRFFNRYAWMLNGIERFERHYGPGKIIEGLPPKYSNHVKIWRRMRTLDRMVSAKK